MLLNDLEYFIMLADECSFTKAAEKLYVSQPSLSNALRRLEEEVGQTLIVRERGMKRVSLTSSGKVLLRHARVIQREIERTIADVAEHPKIRLGVPPIIGAQLFPKIVSQLGAVDIDALKLVEAGSSEMLRLLTTDKVDFAFMGLDSEIGSDLFRAHFILKSPFVVCLPKNHRLAGRASVALSELANDRFISFGQGFVQSRVLAEQLRKEEMFEELDNLYETNELATAKALIASGVGVGLMIDLAVNERDNIVKVPLLEPIYFYIYLLSNRTHQLTDFEEAFQQKVMAAARKI